uniref:Putative secreted protein n=1 Tax=Ixodes ricinus TaxID=34613 RepID=A0A6B0UAI4_IXORI
MPHWLNSTLIRSLVFMRVYSLGKLTTAVMTVMANTSAMGYCPRRDSLRYLHQRMLHLMKMVATTPPSTPSSTNGKSSKNSQGKSYST